MSFTFNRQNGHASNQFAVWIEDARGQYINTLTATRWTANGGWKRRPASIPLWVKKSGLVDMKKAQIDAVSSATPRSGTLNFIWDGTDNKGKLVANGEYVLVLEATLRWENQAYYRVPVSLGNGSAAPQAEIEYSGDGAVEERSMISDFKVKVLR